MLPNLIIAGAPKCGSTSLFTWLADHPEVCGTVLKETKYLVDPGTPLYTASANYLSGGVAGYQDYFAHCGTADAKWVVEGTPEYLYRTTALDVLSALDPQPTVVFVFREPADRTYSFYQYARNNMGDISMDLSFREFLVAAQESERAAETAGHGAIAKWRDYAIRFSHYADFVDLWLARFPRNKIHAFLFEELQRDNRAFMRHVAQSLDIAPTFYDDYDFPHKRPTYRVRSQAVHRLRLAAGRLVQHKAVKTGMRRIMRRPYAAINIAAPVHTTTEDERRVLEELTEYFAPYNERLARSLDLDLSGWNRRSARQV